MKTALLGIFTIVLAHVLLSQERPSYRLPTPTGPFAVGRAIVWWTDQTRREEAPAQSTPRGLGAYIYYPADAGGTPADYYPGLTDLESIPETKLLAQHFGSTWPQVKSGLVHSNAYSDAPFSNKLRNCPVLVFSPGGSAPIAAYSAQLEELTSDGYVVVGLEHPYDTALIIGPDHRLIPFVDRAPQESGPPTIAGLEANLKEVVRWEADSKFALDQIESLSRNKGTVFFQRLDLSRIGVFGHSLGGKAAARFCQTDVRVRACLNEDGELFGIPFGSNDPIPSVIPGHPTQAPFVDIYVAEPLASDAQLAAVHVTREQFENWRHSKTEALRSFCKRNTQPSDWFVIRRPGFTHGGFMDIAELGSIIGRTDHSRAKSNLELANRITVAFFDSTLKRDDESWNRMLADTPAGVSVESWAGQHTP